MSPYVKSMVVSALVTALGAYLTFLIYKRRVRVDLDAKAEGSRIDMHSRRDDLELKAQAAPVQILKDELAKREAEIHEMRDQDRAERDQYIKTLTAMQTALEQLVEDLKAHRREEHERSGGFHSRLDTVDDRLLVIETQLGVKKS